MSSSMKSTKNCHRFVEKTQFAALRTVSTNIISMSYIFTCLHMHNVSHVTFKENSLVLVLGRQTFSAIHIVLPLRLAASRGHIQEALATLRPRESFVRQPVNNYGTGK
jgi:hypothetical protein